MPPARLARRRVSRAQTRGRVVRPVTPQQWDKVIKRAGPKLVLALFSVESGRIAFRLRAMMSELSGQSEYRNVEFVMVDMEKAPELAEEQGVLQGVVVAAYQHGVQIEKTQRMQGEYAGTQLYQLLQRHTARVNAELAGRNRKRAKILWIGGSILTLASIIGGTVMYHLLRLQEEMEEIEEYTEQGSSSDQFLSNRPSYTEPLDGGRWWSGDEEEEENADRWTEFDDTDRNDFSAPPVSG
ncbi:hypothetical protein BSKO_13010 [Bryopsis sp. KO-2023]|nr:hypothetical protein BSKO_13010 [Bryopsis sp. KO-2023]